MPHCIDLRAWASILLPAGLAGAAGMACAVPQTWHFDALLDGQLIGEHRFELSPPSDGAQTLLSEARFDVRLLGVTLYRYRHRAQEVWVRGCLQSIHAETDDNGERTQVARSAGTGLPAGCPMSFAYWNPAILQAKQLLNAQTGRSEEVQVQALPPATLEVRGATVTARRWRIAAPKQRIDVWYDAEGRWMGLDATLEGSRQLRYRLK